MPTNLVLQAENSGAAPQLHRKHLRVENQDLREQVSQTSQHAHQRIWVIVMQYNALLPVALL